MTNHVQLDNVKHKDLRIITRHGSDLDDNLTFALVFPQEFRRLQGDYPIFFRKANESQRMEALALFGFAEGENLFVDEKDWHADYIPLTVERRPFMIGFKPVEEDGQTKHLPVVHIDMDSPRISETEGEPIFLPHGGNSPLLDKSNSTLKEIFHGDELTKDFAAALEEHQLLEAFTLRIDLAGDNKLNISGFYTINEDKFNQLSDKVLGELHRNGFLHYIYMMIASVNNIHKMIRLKNARIEAAKD